MAVRSLGRLLRRALRRRRRVARGPVRHRYVHGGFAGTEPGSRSTSPPRTVPGPVLPAHHAGAGQREPRPADRRRAEQDRLLGRAAARTSSRPTAAARMPRPVLGHRPDHRRLPRQRRRRPVLAGRRAAMYGEHRPYGYAYGGSGGGVPHHRRRRRTPTASGTASSRTSPAARWRSRTCSPSACTPSGSCATASPRSSTPSKPAATRHPLDLTDEERDALAEVTRMGFPPRSWFGCRTMGMHAFPVLYPGVHGRRSRPTSRTSGPSPAISARDAGGVRAPRPRSAAPRPSPSSSTEAPPSATTSSAGGVDESFLHTASTAPRSSRRVRLAERREGGCSGRELLVRSGRGRGHASSGCSGVDGDVAVLEPGPGRAPRGARGPATRSSSTTAASSPPRPTTATRCPDAEYAVWDQFRDADGSPLLPAAPAAARAAVRAAAAGTVQTGRISGKMIVVASLLDREAFPWQADWYRARVAEHSATPSTITSASGSSTTRCTATTSRRRPDPHGQLPRRARTRRCATSPRGSRTASARRRRTTLRGRRRAGRRPRDGRGTAGRPAGRERSR